LRNGEAEFAAEAAQGVDARRARTHPEGTGDVFAAGAFDAARTDDALVHRRMRR
jgi:hypothetical protein